MDETKRRKLLDDAVKQVHGWLQSENCILFVGAGVSRRSLQDPPDVGVKEEEEWPDSHRDPNKTLREAAREFAIDKPGCPLKHYYSDLFRNRQPRNAHYTIARLPFRTVITANIDDFLEKAYKRTWKRFATVVLDDDLRDVGQKEVTIVKPHGCINETYESDDILVFTDEQYDAFEGRRPQIGRWLNAVFATHHIVFLGYSHRDENFLKFYKHEKSLQSTDRERPGGWEIKGIDQTEHPGFANLTGIRTLPASAEEFLDALEARILHSSSEPGPQREAILWEFFQNAPPTLITNCRMACHAHAVPVEIFRHGMLDAEDKTATAKYVGKLYEAGLIAPTLCMGRQWWNLSPRLIEALMPRGPATSQDVHALRNFFETYSDQKEGAHAVATG